MHPVEAPRVWVLSDEPAQSVGSFPNISSVAKVMVPIPHRECADIELVEFRNCLISTILAKNAARLPISRTCASAKLPHARSWT